MEFRVTIDITERLEKSLKELVKAMYCAGLVTEHLKKDGLEKAENLPVETPKEPEPVITPSAPENAPEAKIDPPADVEPEAAAQNDNAEQGPSKEPEKKPAKKRASKKAESLPSETPKEPEPVITPSEPENAPDAKIDRPADAKPEQPEPAASNDDDPMCGMTVMEAMQAVMNEINEKGLEMADVNARVRARAAEAGIAYSSIICLIKAIGYKEARRVALGEK